MIRLYGTLQDVTKEKENEKQEARFRRALEQSPSCIVVTDVEGIVEYVNPAFERITGFTTEEVIGKKTNILSSQVHNNKFYTELWDTIKNGKVWQGEFCNRKKNGELYWESASISPVFDRNQNIINFLAIKEDITKTKKLIEELQDAKNRAELSDQLKSAFLANMSHEIRTPMNGILGFIDLLRTPNLSELEKSNYSEIINQSGRRLLDTINDIIDYSKIETGDIPLNIKEFNIADIYRNQAAFFKLEAKRKNLNLKFIEPQNSEVIKVMADRNKFESVLTNLLKNAIKFTDTGEIEFGFEIIGNTLTSYVRDTGIGIPKEKIESIFERFVQADLKITRGYEGSGLGLAICKAYVEKMGGKIWVESETGKGSTFRFSIKTDGQLVSNETDKDKELAKDFEISTIKKKSTKEGVVFF